MFFVSHKEIKKSNIKIFIKILMIFYRFSKAERQNIKIKEDKLHKQAIRKDVINLKNR